MTVKPKTKGKSGVTAAVFAAGLALAAPMVAKHEGVWLVAKPDKLAYGIPTVCYGETEGVNVGDRYTPRQCEDMLLKKLVRYANSAAACIYVPVSPKMFSTFIDLNYNIGEAAFCRSTVARKINALDYEGGCEAMRAWVNAGGEFRQGLLNRRLNEIAVCREGIRDIGKPAAFVPKMEIAAAAPAPVPEPPTPAPALDPVPQVQPAPVAAPAKPGFWCRLFNCEGKA